MSGKDDQKNGTSCTQHSINRLKPKPLKKTPQLVRNLVRIIHCVRMTEIVGKWDLLQVFHYIGK